MAFSLGLLLLFTSKLDALLAARSEINAAPFSGIAIPPTSTTAGPRREGQELSLWQKVAGVGSAIRGYWDAAMVKVGEWLELWTASKDDKQIAWTLGIGWACCGGGLAGGCLVFAKASYVASSFEPSNTYLDDQRSLVFNLSQARFRTRTPRPESLRFDLGSSRVLWCIHSFWIFNNEVDAYQSWTLFLIFVSILILISGVVLLTHKKPEPLHNKAKTSPVVSAQRSRRGRTATKKSPGDGDDDEAEAGEDHALRTRVEGEEDGEALWSLGDASDDEDDGLDSKAHKPLHATGSSSCVHLGDEGARLINGAEDDAKDGSPEHRDRSTHLRRSMSSDATLPVSAKDTVPFSDEHEDYGEWKYAKPPKP
ncbi:transporter [Salix suchowensis]|nr:transporter [Salix suchowensis]